MLEVERSSKLADINRQIKEAQAATETLRTSPTSAEATMIVLNLKVQAENAEATAAASDEAEKIAALNAELKSAKEELRRENEVRPGFLRAARAQQQLFLFSCIQNMMCVRSCRERPRKRRKH
jgi:hypothetical protein